MTRAGSNIADKTRALVEAGRALDEPSAADRERVRARLTAALSAAAVATTASKTAAAPAERGASAAAQTTATRIGAGKLFGSWGTATVLAAAAASGVVWLRGTQHAARAPVVQTAQPSPVRSAATSGSSETASPISPSALDRDTPGAPRALELSEPLAAAAVPNRKLSSVPRLANSRQRAALERRALTGDSDASRVQSSRDAARATKLAANTALSASATQSAAAATAASRSNLQRTAASPPTETSALPASVPTASGAQARALSAAVTDSDVPPSAAEARQPTPPAETAQPAAPPTAASARSLAGELALLDAAQRALAQGELRSALAQLDQHAARFPGGGLVPERLAARAVTLCRMQRDAEGRRELQRLQARAPASPLLTWARAACGSQTR